MMLIVSASERVGMSSAFTYHASTTTNKVQVEDERNLGTLF